MDAWSLVVVLGLTLLAISAASYSYAETHLKDIKANWVKYRCNPLYMPLAGLVGSDILSNFTGCTMGAIQNYAGYALDPVYSMFGNVGSILSDIQGAMNDIRSMLGGTSNAFLSIVDDTYGKLTNTMSTSMKLMARIRTLNNRLLAAFVVMLHTMDTGIQTGASINNGPIGQAARFFSKF